MGAVGNTDEFRSNASPTPHSEEINCTVTKWRLEIGVSSSIKVSNINPFYCVLLLKCALASNAGRCYACYKEHMEVQSSISLLKMYKWFKNLCFGDFFWRPPSSPCCHGSLALLPAMNKAVSCVLLGKDIYTSIDWADWRAGRLIAGCSSKTAFIVCLTSMTVKSFLFLIITSVSAF